MSVTLTQQGLNINGTPVPVYSGAVNYWRLERDLWPRILDQVVALGFHMVELYIPWSVHETSPGHYDWGQENPRKDLDAFLTLCEERDIWVLARPGPLINSELTDFGFPEWVLLDPQVQARTALDTPHISIAFGIHPPRPFPVPSYASEAFYTAIGGWFDAVCPVMRKHLAPDGGCIVAVQSDNETCYMFHDQPYATDYSDGSLALYRRFLAERYGDIKTLNNTYSATYADFAQVEPPRDCEIETRHDVPRHIDWITYKEYLIIWHISRVARMMRQRGITDVPMFQDVAFQTRTPLDIAAMQADPEIDWVGINLYRNQEEAHKASAIMRYLVGMTPLPFIPELGAGIWCHYLRAPTADEQTFITLLTLMLGVKAFSFYMLVERERWLGSPIKRQGEFRETRAPFYRQLMNFLETYNFPAFERRCDVAVLHNYDLDRLAAALSTLHYAHVDLYGLPPELSQVDVDLGLRWDVEAAINHRQPESWLNQAIAALQAHSIDFDLADSHASHTHLSKYRALFLPTADLMSPDDQETLLAYVKAGGHLIVGPGMPYLDPHLNPATVFADHLDAPGTRKIGAGRLTWLADTAELTSFAATHLPTPAYRCDAGLDLAVHHAGDRELLFVANLQAETITADVHFAGARTFTDAWGASGTTLHGQGQATFVVPPYTVQIWEVQA